jgi:hypothetical protein
MADKSRLDDTMNLATQTALSIIVHDARSKVELAITNGYVAIDLVPSTFSLFADSHIDEADVLKLLSATYSMLSAEGLSAILVPSIRLDYGYARTSRLDCARWKRHGPVVLYLVKANLLAVPRIGHLITVTLSIREMVTISKMMHKYVEFNKSFDEMQDGSYFSRNIYFDIVDKP